MKMFFPDDSSCSITADKERNDQASVYNRTNHSVNVHSNLPAKKVQILKKGTPQIYVTFLTLKKSGI
jgi:hypothetical protein